MKSILQQLLSTLSLLLLPLSCKLFHISHVNQFQNPRKQKVKFIPTALSLGANVLCYLSYCCDQVPGERELKGEGFLLAHSVRVCRGRKAGLQEWEAAGYPVHTTRKLREMEAHAMLTFSLYASQDPGQWNAATHFFPA